MADLLKEWLRSTLGVFMDLRPDMFGRYTRDGTLLAQILHNYGIITKSQLSTIVRTHDPALSRVNLRILRIWLKLINVTLSDSCLKDMSNAKGSAALQLFYKVYLGLEGKDRLFFIALQKERERLGYNRFEVVKVPESPPSYCLSEHPHSKPLIKSAETISWYRNKFSMLTEACRQERRRFEDVRAVVDPVKCFIPHEKEEEIKADILDEFARQHAVPKMKKKYEVVECCPAKKFLVSCCIKDSAAAEYVDFLKKRSGKAARAYELRLKSQMTMMTNAWEQLLKEQDRSFDEALGKQVLDQSRYEKRMIRKLCEVWDIRNKITENRRIVDDMLLTVMENEQRLAQDRERLIIKEDFKDIKREICRMRELRQRICDEKIRKMRERHRGICLEIVRDLVDIAIKLIQSREADNSSILHAVWSECRTLFLTNQPIFGDFDKINYINDEEEARIAEKARDEEEMMGEVEYEEDFEEEFQEEEKELKLEYLNDLVDRDFESYRDLNAPWDEFLPKREEEVEETSRLGCIVLGYVVHRLLQILYFSPFQVAPCPIPRVKVMAIILGITNSTLHEQLRELLKDSEIRLLRMEDAINHCLESYKQEMSHMKYIDLDIISTTARDVRKLESKSKTDEAAERHLKIMEKTKKVTPRAGVTEEKQTQTPRQIPYDDMDPILSDAAYIGKWTYQFLMLGQPISNELNTKILIEYLKEIGDINGWALINYPNTYEQMTMLEKALIDHDIPPECKTTDFADISIEDIDPSSPRIIYKSNEKERLAACRQSRLLPNPILRKDLNGATFMTIYIRAMPKPKVVDEEPCAAVPEDANSIDEFYANEQIAYGFFYSVLDLPTLKQLAELITGDFFTEEEYTLEEEVPEAYKKKQKPPIDTKAAIIKRLVTRSKWESTRCEEDQVEHYDLQPEIKTQLFNSVKPGEDDWQWLDLPQSPILLEVLGALWESVEEAYVENLKEILSLKRMHESIIVPYKNFVLKNLTQFVERPDNRQILLQDFHRAFNEIDKDLREDIDMKCELYCRVDDFRTELWELCDARRHQAEDERKHSLQNYWILMEVTLLLNVYITILQVEIDRFVDTMQLLQDYYTSMSQKPIQESRFSKIVLELVESQDFPQKTSPNKKEQVNSKGKNESSRTSARVTNNDRFKSEIEAVLTDVSKSFDPDENSIYNFIKDNIRRVRGVVDSISSRVLETLKKEEKNAVLKSDTKGKGVSPLPSALAKLVIRSRDLIEEWRYASFYEIERVRQRLDILNAAARSDIAFFLDIMRQMYHHIHQYIVERYKQEIESISEMANVFCFAIEQEKAIQPELVLDGDQFIIRPNVLMYHDDQKQLSISIKEVPSPLRFRMVQLARLIDIFRRIAPCGSICERALVYILQDLVSCEEEDCYPCSVPCMWRQLRAPDIERLIKEMFGATECIEWREFIVYAMDLPMPTYADILKTRASLGMQDFDSAETISRSQFHSTPLWFLEVTLRNSESNLHKTCLETPLIDDLDFGDMIMDMMLHEEARLGDMFTRLKSKRDLLEVDENDYGVDNTVLRLTLAKELLCQMYLVNRNKIHYSAMLLAFCKDKDPREGLGKAFTLAMGVRVCTNKTEGEKYVQQYIRERERLKKLQMSQEYLREKTRKVAEDIIDLLMHKVEKTFINNHLSLPGQRRIMIQQLENGLDIDPVELLPIDNRVTPEHLIIKEPYPYEEDEYELPMLPRTTMTIEEDAIPDVDERVIHWLPRDVCLMVLSACLPRFASQPYLFQTSLTLHEGIMRVYEDLWDEELNDDKDLVLSHRLVNHRFILELFSISSKFVSRNMADILRSILNRNDTSME